jgi:UDP:flavonoid glycosyltransferase YjiC (YdhE family)
VKILLMPFGSAGDVHPFVGLGAALHARGHEVTVATNDHFAPLVEREGFAFAPLGTEEEFRDTLNDPNLWHPTRAFRVVVGALLRLLRRSYDLVAERYVPGATIVISSMLGFGPRIAHDKLGVPFVTVHLQPSVLRSVYRSSHYGALVLPDWLPKPAKRLIFRFLDAALIDPLVAPATNALRAELGLSPVRRLFDQWMHSPQLVLGLFPDWFGPPQPDWPPQTVLTGFPLYDEAGVRPEDPDLSRFLDAGDPPIVFTPGSAMRQAHAFFRESVEACSILGRRGILLTRFRDQVPADLPESVRQFDYVPFSRVLPRSALLVHHGGIGTTAQALAAGIPHLVMPLAHDQPDNAARLQRLGVARSIPPRRYDARRVARTINPLIESPRVADRCRELARRTLQGNPLATACEAIERLGPVPAPAQGPGVSIA